MKRADDWITELHHKESMGGNVLDLYGHKVEDIHTIVDSFVYEHLKLNTKDISIFLGSNNNLTKGIVCDIIKIYGLNYTECVYNPSLLKISS